MTTQQPRQCKLPECATCFLPPKGAENKEFCCASHRYQFHALQRKLGLRLLAEQQAAHQPTLQGEKK